MYLKFKFLTLLFGCISILGCAQSKKEITPKTYVAYKASEAITIDGISDESSWDRAKWSDNFIDIEGVKIPTYQTNVKMIWDDNNLYFYAELEEPHIWGDITVRDEVIFYNNDFEIFIDPDGDTHNYYEFEMNALNTIWDLFLSKPYRDHGKVLNNWDINGLKSAVKIDGTINDPTDKDKKWSVEIAMPWKVLVEASGSKEVPADKSWRLGFSRVNWDFDLIDGKYNRKKDKSGKYLPEYNWVWSPTGVINMHEPEKWGYVYFSSKKRGETDSFKIPNDEKIKWELYKLYRAQNSYYESHNSFAPTIESLITSDIIVEGITLQAQIETHSMGYNITIKSPFSDKILTLKEDGKFISK